MQKKSGGLGKSEVWNFTDSLFWEPCMTDNLLLNHIEPTDCVMTSHYARELWMHSDVTSILKVG